MNLDLARVERLNLGLSTGAVAASFAFATPHFAGSMAAGAFLEALNLGLIHRGARRLFGGELGGARSWIGVFSLRFLVLASAIFVTMQAGADPAALLIGLSLAMPATVIDAWLNRPPVIDPATLPTLPVEESEDDLAYWENYSVWRPGRMIVKAQDDLMAEAQAERAAEDRELERAQWEQVAPGPPQGASVHACSSPSSPSSSPSPSPSPSPTNGVTPPDAEAVSARPSGAKESES